ncbi:MAG: hypothetical protein A2X94_15950 [Bdellovibrionales bacterium GWB1_55_8]|nr:MAG: hypothetical protein A2X94_15950 [Bdellovibrionales bacterium GWB1_55_8]
MKPHSERSSSGIGRDFRRQREQIIGLGEKSFKKTYFPELQRRLAELERFRLLIEQTGEAIFLFRVPDAGMIDVNRAACLFTGLSKEELLATSITELWDSGSAEQISRLLADPDSAIGRTTAIIGALRGPEAHQQAVETTFQLASLEDGKYAVAVARDIAVRKRAEEALLVAKERAERADRAKSEFLNIASHELRTPITSATLLLELLKKQLAAGQTVTTMTTIDRMRRQLDHLASMVFDMIDISRLERGTLSIRREQGDIVRLVHDVVESFRLRTKDHEVVFNEPLEAITVDVDPVRIAQVLDNFLDNAGKYSPSGAPILVKCQTDRGKVRISVSDQGEGISDEELQYIFKRFFRSNSDIVRRNAGLGLGLYISKEIVELHGGQIFVETAPGAGSTFSFEIPI